MQLPVKILIMGLSGSGKTTLATQLAAKLHAVHFNADEIRKNICTDLTFSPMDRIEQSKRLGWLSTQVTKAGHNAVVDFICPTVATRVAFGSCYLIFMDTVKSSKYADTDALFVAPASPDYKISSFIDHEEHIKCILQDINKRQL